MPRNQDVLFVGIYNSVVALDARDGTELWRVKLGGTSLVNVFWDGEQLYATSKGEVFGIDHRNGQIAWHNRMKGLGFGLVTLASTRAPNVASQQMIVDAQRHASTQRSATAAAAT